MPINQPLETVYLGPKESTLRALKETPLRALQIGGLVRADRYISINTMSQLGHIDPGLAGFVPGAVYPNPHEGDLWQFQYYNDHTSQILFNLPAVQIGIGDTVDTGDPGLPGTQKANWWFDQFAATLNGWTPSKIPILQWTITNRIGWIEIPSTFTIKGFVVWPVEVCNFDIPDPDHQFVLRCVSKSRSGASITLYKKGITGIITLHDVVTRPTNQFDGEVGPATNVPSLTTTVNITDDGEFVFTCPADKVMCFWLGLSFGDLPNSGFPHYHPIGFNPHDYGLLSPYRAQNPPLP